MKCVIFVTAALSFLSLPARTQIKQDPSFRVVGYYSLQSAMNKSTLNVPFTKLTHVNLFFLNPDTFGNFKKNYSALIPFIKKAHDKNVKVLVSIGGGGRHPYYAKLLNDTNRAVFIHKLVTLVTKYDLDGVDVDIEGSDIDANYGNFSAELAQALHLRNKIITAAIAIYFKNDYSDKALAQYDFLNLMSYDHTAAWAPQKPGPHASYEQAIDDLTYFRMTRSIPKDNITLGVPFYGYGFGPKHQVRGVTMNYNHIVTAFPTAELSDEWNMNDSTVMYYNGMTTIKMKTLLAKEQASGIMIWQLSGDAPGSKSLLGEIDRVAKENSR